ncbi:zinc-finger homeodomain protein 9-like [Andrographis paniculata]|uniref:zinc-finger homeodomain protein 9-like n=1 Tax=Andrographis paniculata TaxID=175694 RepID=UPI0021E88391|nr:zinc-finger homeodomain protein 9-like [Andrographis paniculata]
MSMDLASSVVKTPEAESETPTRIQPPPLTNGAFKRLQINHPVVVTYKECLKNHAAAIGGHAVDGCGEFMPAPNSNPAEPTTLKCAACGCHRNFHRREPDEPPPPPIPLPLPLPLPPSSAVPALEYQPHHRHHPLPPPRRAASPNNSPSPPPISSSYYPSAPHMLLALSHGLSSLPSDCNITTSAAAPVNSSGHRKRYRTKFTQNQKDRMQEFAEKIGWKMQKAEEDATVDFLSEIGVDKGVFKVWMHNNKNAGKKEPPSQSAAGISTPPTSGASADNGGHESTTGQALGTNGTSSSS